MILYDRAKPFVPTRLTPYCLRLHFYRAIEHRTNVLAFEQTTFSDLAQAHDQPGILKSRDYFNALVKEEIEKGIPSSRIVIGMTDSLPHLSAH